MALAAGLGAPASPTTQATSTRIGGGGGGGRCAPLGHCDRRQHRRGGAPRIGVPARPRPCRPPSAAAPRRQPLPPGGAALPGVSPTRVLQAVELGAIAVAAAYQAALLVGAGLLLSRTGGLAGQAQAEQPAAAAALHRQQRQHGKQEQEQQQQQPAGVVVFLQDAKLGTQAAALQQQRRQEVAVAHPAAPDGWPRQLSVGGQLQSLALLLALMCGAALRYLQQPRRSLAGASVSADAAARLVALEVAAQQQAAQLTAASRLLDKLQARVRLATSDLKVPLRQAQGNASQAAAALAKLADQQQRLQVQLDGSQELIAALQGLAAKQFKVSAEALQQLKAGQAQLSSSTSAALSELQQQQAAMQAGLRQQRAQVDALERRWVAARLAGGGTQEGFAAAGSGPAAGDEPPDPWAAHKRAAAAAVAPSNGAGGSG